MIEEIKIDSYELWFHEEAPDEKISTLLESFLMKGDVLTYGGQRYQIVKGTSDEVNFTKYYENNDDKSLSDLIL